MSGSLHRGLLVLLLAALFLEPLSQQSSGEHAEPGARTGLTTSAKSMWLMPTRVVHFQIVPSIANDGIDGYDLYLARVVEGLHFSLGVMFEHCRDSGRVF